MRGLGEPAVMFLQLWAISPHSLLKGDIAEGLGNKNQDKVRVRLVGLSSEEGKSRSPLWLGWKPQPGALGPPCATGSSFRRPVSCESHTLGSQLQPSLHSGKSS